MTAIQERHCVACEKGTAPLDEARVESMLREVPSWSLNSRGRLEKTFSFPDFAGALRFVDRVGALAEAERHHPDIHLSWGKAVVELWSHKVGGLTDNDFILAAKIDGM